MANILPNDIIMRIIREADGGHRTHKKKMNDIFEMILGSICDQYCDDDRIYAFRSHRWT